MPPRLKGRERTEVTPLVTHHSDHRAARDIVIGRAERMLSYRILLCRIVSFRIVSYRIVSYLILSYLTLLYLILSYISLYYIILYSFSLVCVVTKLVS